LKVEVEIRLTEPRQEYWQYYTNSDGCMGWRKVESEAVTKGEAETK